MAWRGSRCYAEACATMGTRLITLCTGTRDSERPMARPPRQFQPRSMAAICAPKWKRRWRLPNDSTSFSASSRNWPTSLSSADAARRLLDEVASPRLKIVLDPANLFEVAMPGSDVPSSKAPSI